MTGLPASIIKKYGVTKKAWSVFRGRHHKSKSRASPKTHKTKKVYSMARKGKHRGGHRGSLLRSAEKLGQAAALIAPHAINMTSGLTTRDKLQHEVWLLSGYAPWSGRFEWEGLANGWGPIVAFTVASKAAHKIMGLIRRI